MCHRVVEESEECECRVTMRFMSLAEVLILFGLFGLFSPQVLSIDGAKWAKKTVITPAVLSSVFFGLPGNHLTAAGAQIKDQLKVVQALQVEKQIDSVQKQKIQLNDARPDSGVLIATGVVAIPPPPGSAIDPSAYPLGFSKAGMVSSRFDDNKASLIITAVPRNGSPFAAKIIRNLPTKSFPLAFTITSDDLLFPYNKEAWASSQYSKDSVAITAVLDEDGLLETPGENTRFGFAIAQVTKKPQTAEKSETKDAVLNSGAGVGEGATFATNAKTGKPAVEPMDVPNANAYQNSGVRSPGSSSVTRREARISISLKAEGSQYSEKEAELLKSIDKQLSSR